MHTEQPLRRGFGAVGVGQEGHQVQVAREDVVLGLVLLQGQRELGLAELAARA